MEEAMKQQSSLEIYSVCRTCLGNLNDLHFDVLQTPDLKRKLIECTSLTVEPDDAYPKNICQVCYHKLNELYEFQQMCISAMQRCKAIILTEMKEYTVDFSSREDNFSSGIFVLDQFDLKQNNDTVIKVHELVNLEASMPKNTDEYAEIQFHMNMCQENEMNEIESNQNDEICNGSSECYDSQVRNKAQNDNKGSRPKKVFFSCDICNKRFQKEIMLAAHRRIHEGFNVFPCSQCDKSFNKLSRLRIHIRIIHERKVERLLCPEVGCDKSYAQPQTLKKHINEAHKGACNNRKPPRYMCEECGKVLTSLSTLKNHRFLHTGKQLPFVCNECGKRYITRHKLKEHMNRHAGIKNYICPHCGARKTTRTELNTHVNYHTKEKTYTCKYCELVFNSIGNLSRHVRTVHEGIKAFPCKYCEKSFGKAETRKHHEMTHTGEKPHECSVCLKKFIQSVSLHRHMQLHYKKSAALGSSKQFTSGSAQSKE